MTDKSFAFHMKKVHRYLPDFYLQVDEFFLPEGHILGLVGPNGAGKSTLIKMLLNLVHPDAGAIKVLGRRQPESEIDIKQRVGYVSDEPVFYDDSTVQWTTKFVSQYYPTWDPDECRRLLARWEIDPKRRIKELSRGGKVKLALTLAMAHRPRLLLLDEPGTGVDPVSRRQMLEEMAAFVSDGDRSILFSSHVTGDVEQIADYVAFMIRGRIVEWDEKDALLSRWRRVSGTLAPNQQPVAATTGSLEPTPGAMESPEPASGAMESPEPTSATMETPESTSAASGVATLASLFRIFSGDGSRFTGVTDHYSPSWREEAAAEGLQDIQVGNVSLEDILVAQGRSASERSGSERGAAPEQSGRSK